MTLIKPLRFITLTFLYFVTVSTMLVYPSDPEIFFDWTVSYTQRAPLGVNKQVVVFPSNKMVFFLVVYIFFLYNDAHCNVFLY